LSSAELLRTVQRPFDHPHADTHDFQNIIVSRRANDDGNYYDIEDGEGDDGYNNNNNDNKNDNDKNIIIIIIDDVKNSNNNNNNISDNSVYGM